MKAKRFILMLLVMLGSVTGAWAQTEERRYDYDYTVDVLALPYIIATYDDANQGLKEAISSKGDDYVQITLSDLGIEFVNTGYDNKPRPNALFSVTKVNSAHVYIESKVSAVTLVSATINDKTYSPTNGSNIIEFNENNFKSITVYYTIIPHTHNIATEWSHNNTQHWHACTGTGLPCPNLYRFDVADHEYNNDITNDAAAYTCSVCGYVNETVKSQYDAREYFSMTAVGAPMTIGMTKTGSPADYDLQYSLDRTHWTSVALTATNSNIVEIPAGQTCYFRHGTETAIDRISSHQSNLWTFTMTGDGSVEAGGNVMSLLDITCQKNTLSVQHVFNSLFKGCAKLTKAPKLPATSLGEYCYWSMFEGTSITEVPELPATSVRTGSYLSMFKDCKQLTIITGANVLSFTSLERRACKEMFMGCENLTSVTLNNITTIYSRSDSDASFYEWLDGTAIDTEGVLIAPDALVGNPLIFLPANWMYKQIKDYTTAVSNATEGTASVVQNIGEEYIAQIKQATSNDAALSLRDEALSDINTLKKYNSKLDASSFAQPTGSGMRMKVTTMDDKVYEFKTQNVKSVDYYRVNE